MISAPPRDSGLNQAQWQAVTCVDGPLLVLAGAGTGKTRVITYRMAELIRRGVAPDRILSVTFTNKAAREMQERALGLLGRRQRSRPVVSTFHSLCVRILRADITRLGYPERFAIYDRGDQESAARRALRDIRISDAALRPGDLLACISRWKMVGITPDQAREFIEDDRDQLAAMAYRRYQSQLRASGAVDFDDLLMLTETLFDQHPDVLERWQDTFSHVQIDEYQDTNELQFRLIEQLVRPHRNLCVVGDDDQSIYGWRGAEIKHILGFQQQFPGAVIVRLQENYRCTEGIIQLANQLVRHNLGRHEKRLVAHKEGVNEINFRNYPDEQAEAEGVVRDIAYLVRHLSVKEDDLAILFRTNEQPRLFESELRRQRLRYVLVGGQSFFDRREVRDLMAYLKVLAFPDDEVSLLRIINTPTRGIGDAAVEKILQRAVKSGTSFWRAVEPALVAGEISARTASNVRGFFEQLQGWRERAIHQPAQLAQLLTDLVKQIDYESEIRKQYKESQQQVSRLAVIDECVTAIKEYTSRSLKPSLTEFLEETSLTGRDDGFGDDDPLKKSGIRLMTLHSAKGLEFPRVYLVGLEEGLLPHQRAVDEGTLSGIEEERRLAYVGITRARDYLTITSAATRTKWGKRRESVPSRFLKEMLTPIEDEEGEVSTSH